MAVWAAHAGREVGAVMPVATLWLLAKAWYRDRLSPEWRRRSIDESQAIFEQVGLTGPFWDLR